MVHLRGVLCGIFCLGGRVLEMKGTMMSVVIDAQRNHRLHWRRLGYCHSQLSG